MEVFRKGYELANLLAFINYQVVMPYINHAIIHD
jgi:hypothetical protein